MCTDVRRDGTTMTGQGCKPRQLSRTRIVPVSQASFIPSSILLLGPTGSGKTPLGQSLERNGFLGTRCRHFDFGCELRGINSSVAPPAIFSRRELGIVRRVLESGALLEDRQFGIAMKTLACFLSRKRVRPDELLLLNGLPRHTGQARRMTRLVNIVLVLYLDCPDCMVFDRISGNAGGDRTHRTDDNEAAVKVRLNAFRKRTLPLVDYYRKKHVPVVRLRVDIGTGTESALRQLRDLAGSIYPAIKQGDKG